MFYDRGMEQEDIEFNLEGKLQVLGAKDNFDDSLNTPKCKLT